MEIRRCPFCGGNNFYITPRKSYYEVLGENDVACISIRCRDCSAEKYDYDDSIVKYEDKLEALINAWNTRVED